MPEQTAPAAPAAPEIRSANDYLNRSDEALEAIVAPAKPAPEKQAPPAEPEVRKDEVPAKPEPEPVTTEQVEDAAPPATEPVEPAVPAAPLPPLLTDFKVADKEGELEIPRELTFSYKANDKQYTDVPIDKVVKMAQMGHYNEQREQQVIAAKQFVAEAQQREADLTARVTEYESFYQRVLADEGFRQRAIAEFAAQNSPEQRAARAEQEVQDIRQQQFAQTQQQQLSSFVATELTPRINKLLADHPTLSQQEVLGHYTMLTTPLLRNGMVPANQLPEVVRLVDNDLRQWVEDRHDQLTKRDAEHKKAADTALKDAAKAKRLIARRTAPPQASAPAQAKPKSKFASADDWMKTQLPLPDDND